MPPRSACLLLVATGLLTFVACGGNVVVDPGSGGGGAAPTSGPGPQSSSSSSTTDSSGPGQSSSSVSSGPGDCDLTGFCGDASQGCIACALAQKCEDALIQCQSSVECVDYVTCIDPCFDEACVQQCVVQFPVGASMYNGLVSCVLCDECPVDCAELAKSTVGFPGCN